MNNVFIARQPVYNKKLEVIGYELLFRNNLDEQVEIVDKEIATAQVILNILLEVGLEKIVGQRIAFINVARDFITSDLVYSLDKEKIVLEISEDIEADPEVIAALQKISKKGYKINLDNFVYDYKKDELIKLANYIKLDVSMFTREELKSQANLLRNGNAQLIASKIETQNNFDVCNEIKMDYYQGYYLAQPNIIKGTRLSAIRYSVLKLHRKFQDPQASLVEIEELLSKDVYLTYRIFNNINNSKLGQQKVATLSEAVELVGLDEIKTWVELLLRSKLDDSPNELLVSVLTRAKMCELLALSLNKSDAGSYFIVGLFSNVDVILDKNMSELLKSLPLTEQMNEALLYGKGSMADALKCVFAYEKGDWEAVTFEGAEKSMIIDSYLKSVDWASDLGTELIAS